MNNEAEITQYIQNVLQRAPLPGEVEAWQTMIDNNSQTLDDVQSAIINGAEAVNDVYPMILAYQAVYGRLPDADGLNYWTGVYKAALGLDNPNTPEIESGPSLDDPNTPTVNEAMVAVLRAFVDPDTPEFVSRFGADPTGDQFVAAAYQNVLNRVPDQAGLNYWQGRYAEIEASYANDHPDASQSDIDIAVRSQILEQFVDSAEYKTSTADEVDQFLANAANETPDAYSGSLWDLQDHTGQTFILTPDADLGAQAGQPFYGTDGDDTYIAGTTNSGLFTGNTLGTGDSLNGAGGNDTLQIIDNGGIPLTPHIANIENVTVQALDGIGDTDVVMTNATGVQEVVNERSVGDVTFEDIQNAVAIGVHGTSSTTSANFHDGADFGDNMQINVDGAGTASYDRANIYVSTDDTPTTLTVDSSGDASFVRVDVDDRAGFGGATNEFETLNITGDADLNLRDNGGEFDHVTTVNVNSTGGVDLNFSGNDEDVTYNGANGSGDDHLNFNNGHDNTIDTGAGNDTVQVWGGGDQTVNLGDGDDQVVFGTNATAADSADGGAGTDTISINVHTLDGLTANSTFEDSIQNFEQVHATGTVASGASATVDLANLDDINYVITDGTQAGQSEIQAVDVSASDSSGGSFFVNFNLPSGNYAVQVAVDPSQTDAQVANAIVSAFSNPDTLASVPGLTNVEIQGSSGSSADNVNFTFDGALGNLDPNRVTITNNSDVATATQTGTDTNGHTGTPETFQITVEAGVSSLGGSIQINNILSSGSGNLTVSLDGGLSVDEVGAAIATAVTAANDSNYTASYNATTNVVSFTSTTHDDLSPDPSVGNRGGWLLQPNIISSSQNHHDGSADIDEVQHYTLTVDGLENGTFANDGRVIIGDTHVDVTAGTTADQLGALLANASLTGTDIKDIEYNTLNNELTVTWDSSHDNITAGAFNADFIGDNNPHVSVGGFGSGTRTVQNGTGADGALTLNNMQSGGTLELAHSNNGDTYVNLTSTLPTDDSFNIVLDDGAGDHNGLVHLDGIETLNVTQMDDHATNLGLAADAATTVTVSGEGGVNFIDPFSHLTSLDASGVTGTGTAGSVTVVTNAAANTSLTGGAGNDSLTGSNESGHVDTINGGAGNDTIIGRAGADILTGGAGNDTFVYQEVKDSQGTTVDTITDFVSKQDTLDLHQLLSGTVTDGTYSGTADGYGAVLTSLNGDGHTAQAVLDSSTSTLYVDVNADGHLTDADLAIHLTGVTQLDSSDFTWHVV